MSAEAALGLPALWACVDTIASQISAMPLQTFRRVGSIRERVPDSPLMVAPSAVWSADEWVKVAVTSMLLYGDAIGVITRTTGTGVPLEIEWVDPRCILVEQVEARLRYSRDGQVIPIERVVHIRHGVLLPGHLRGRSPIADLAAPLRAGIEAIVFELDWFRNGAHPSGIISIGGGEKAELNLPEVVADTIVQRFITKTKARKPVVLGGDVRYDQVQSAPEAAGLDAARQRVATEIANVFHLPPEMVGGVTGSLTYKTLETDQAALDVRALRPVYTRLERAVTRLLPDETYVRFNADVGVRTDLRTRAEVGEILIRSGQRTVNEVRAKDDLPPLPEESGKVSVRDLTGMLQQIYLATDKVITVEEAREILNRAGAGLTPGPINTGKGAA
ncbi:MAG: phage portal protein [Acidimicrobiales bacterium]